MDKKICLISIVSPVFKAEEIIDELVKRISNSVSKITNDFEIILVDDGSPDNSWEVIKNNCKADKRVKGIKLSRNFGQHYAITAGLEASCGDYVVVMDCDLQDDPRYIPEMYNKIKEGYDILFTRMSKRSHSFIRTLYSKAFKIFLNLLSESNFHDENINNFSLITRKVASAYCNLRDRQRHYLMILRWLGFKHTFLDVDHKERFVGKSSYTFSKLCGHALDGIVSQSYKLLRLSVALGFIFSFISLLIFFYIVVMYFISGFKEGWSSIICLILLSTGVILIFNGILGIYLGKTFEQVKNRPLYLVDQKLNI